MPKIPSKKELELTQVVFESLESELRQKAGLEPSTAFINIGLSPKRQPIYFEMNSIDPQKLRQYMQTQPQKKNERKSSNY
jgi:hypothetical protein